jgi:hypothetical protein
MSETRINRHPVRSTEDGVEYVRLSDLPERTSGEFLWCPECGGEFSATRGDYFWKPPAEPFVCDDCDQEPLRLATVQRIHTVLVGEEVKDIEPL